jgi:hypothetical protein
MRKVCGALALACAVAACQRGETEPPPAPAGEPHSYAFTLEGERLLLAGEAPEETPIDATGPTLRFVARDARGRSTNGTIVDPRVADLEVLGGQGFKRLSYLNGSGMFTLTLPQRPEALDLFDGDRRIASLGAALTTRVLPQSVGADAGPPKYATKLIDHGDCGSNVNLLFMPEGYRAEEMGLFRDRVKSIMAGLVDVAGFRENAKRFDAWISEIPSQESGLTDGENVKQTAWGVRYGVADRAAIYWGDRAVPQGTIDQWRQAKSEASSDATIIVVNSTERLGASDRKRHVVFLSAFPGAGRGLAHELGHALLQLADEYDYGPCNLDSGRISANTTKTPDAPPWSAIVKTAPIEGADSCPKGIWKPTASCLMHDQGEDLCPVCLDRLQNALFLRGPECRKFDCSSEANDCPAGLFCSNNGKNSCCRKPFKVEHECQVGSCGPGKVCSMSDAEGTSMGCVTIDEGCE